jgi:hypothetical protein
VAAAPSQAPTALAYPSAGSSDPFSASFYATQAALQFSQENLLAEDQRETRVANANYEYGRSVNARAEPLALTRNQNSANSQGLAESGVLAKQQGQTQTGYAQKGARLGETRRNAVEKLQAGESTAKTDYALKTNENIANAQKEQLTENEANPTQAIGSTAANPGGVRSVTEAPNPATGVLSYSERTPNGSVAVGNATRAARLAREAAAKKVLV